MIRLGPSQAKPPKGLAKVCAPTAAWYAPGRTLLNAKEPFGAAVDY